jgi:carbon monoxide dehydrogenase subunit G
MGIPIEKSFVVDAPASAVWELLTDPARVASCLPGAAITGKDDDKTWSGTMTVKVGPVTASYRGKIRFERLDAVAREAEIAASGQETRGKGGADMRMKSRVVERGPAETEVTIVSDVNVVGVLAQFGRGMIQDVSDQMFLKFTEAMRRQLAAPAAAAVGTAAAPATATAATAAPAAAAPAAAAPAATAPAAATIPGAAAAGAPAPAGAAVPRGDVDVGAAEIAGAAPGEAGSPPPARQNVLDVGALGTAALGHAAARTLRRPGFWIAAALLVLIVYWLASR